MTWFKVDDSFFAHPRVLACSTAAVGVWVLAGSWSAQQLTDGEVPERALTMIGGNPAEAAELVAAGLWEPMTGGWRFVGWDRYQPLRSDVERAREEDAARKRPRRSRQEPEPPTAPPGDPERNPSGIRAESERNPSGIRAESERNPDGFQASRPDPTRPDLYNTPSGVLTAVETTAAPKQRRKPQRPVPEDWLPDLPLREWVRQTCPTVEVDVEVPRFRDYHRSRDNRFADVNAAFRTWARNQVRWRAEKPGSPSAEVAFGGWS